MTPWRPGLPPAASPSRHRKELWPFLGWLVILAVCALVLAFG